MTNLVIEITVQVPSDDVIEQAAVLMGFSKALGELKAQLPGGASCTSRLVKTRAPDAKPAGRKPRGASPNGAEGRQQPSV